jgi:hypothetical protein
VFVLVDLAATHPAVTLAQPDDCTRFHLQVTGARDPALLASTLAEAGAGRLVGDDAFVRVDAVRAMAAGRVGAAWQTDFDGMLDYARTKGWVDDAGEAIQAHVEWQSPV